MLRLIVLFSVLALSLALPECDVYNYNECDNEGVYDREHRTGCRYCSYLDMEPSDCFISREEWLIRFDEQANGDGSISEEEYVSFWQELLVMCESEARAAFALLDTDGNGSISSDEAAARFDNIDWDSDGSINQDEFAHDFYMFLYSDIVDSDCGIGK